MNEYDFVHPHWLAGRPLLAKKPTPTKGFLTKHFGQKWFKNSKEILNSIVDLWNPNFDQANFLVRIKGYTDQLLETYLATQSCPLKIPKSLVERVDSFETLNLEFSKFVSSISIDLPSDSKALIDHIDALINESNFFISQFKAIVDLIWLGRELPFKPTDRLRKQAFLKAVIANSEKLKKDSVVYSFDFRGHGSHFCENETDLSEDTLVNDTIKVLLHIHQNNPNSAINLVGHSMGGAIATKTANKIQNEMKDSALGMALLTLFIIDVVEGTAMEALPFME
jgi:hypothetical protein